MGSLVGVALGLVGEQAKKTFCLLLVEAGHVCLEGGDQRVVAVSHPAQLHQAHHNVGGVVPIVLLGTKDLLAALCCHTHADEDIIAAAQPEVVLIAPNGPCHISNLWQQKNWYIVTSSVFVGADKNTTTWCKAGCSTCCKI